MSVSLKKSSDVADRIQVLTGELVKKVIEEAKEKREGLAALKSATQVVEALADHLD